MTTRQPSTSLIQFVKDEQISTISGTLDAALDGITSLLEERVILFGEIETRNNRLREIDNDIINEESELRGALLDIKDIANKMPSDQT